MQRWTILIAGLALVLSAVVGPAPVAATSTGSACHDDVELEIIRLINDYRVANGRGRLATSQTLSASAEHHSLSMANHDYFSHDLLPEGISPFDNMDNHGYDYNTWRGENLAGGQTTAQQVFDAWRNSPEHNSAMLSNHFNAIGLGGAYNANSKYKWYWTANFGGYVDARAKTCGGDSSPSSSPASSALKIVASGHSANSTAGLRAYDRDRATAWQSTTKNPPDSAFVIFDLGAVKSVDSIEWTFSAVGGADDLRIAVSDNKRDWTRIGQFGNSPSADTWQSLAYNGSARYVRFAFKNPNRDRVLGHLSEVRVLG